MNSKNITAAASDRQCLRRRPDDGHYAGIRGAEAAATHHGQMLRHCHEGRQRLRGRRRHHLRRHRELPITRAMPGSTYQRELARRSRHQRARVRSSRPNPDLAGRRSVRHAPVMLPPSASWNVNYVHYCKPSGASRRRLQARAFSRHHCRAAANRILRSARRELYGRRRTAACAARRVARALRVVGSRCRAVDRLDAAARSRPSRAT